MRGPDALVLLIAKVPAVNTLRLAKLFVWRRLTLGVANLPYTKAILLTHRALKAQNVSGLLWFGLGLLQVRRPVRSSCDNDGCRGTLVGAI